MKGINQGLPAHSDLLIGEKLLSVHIVYLRTGCPKRTIRRMAGDGRIPAFRINRRAWGIPQSAVSLIVRRRASCWR